MNERTGALLKLSGFVLFLCAVGSAFVFLSGKERTDREADPWVAREDEVVEIVKRCPIPGTDGNVLQLTSGYLEMAKASGNFTEFEGWYAFQVADSLYEAGVGYKVNGVRKTARWDLDLSRRTMKPRNQEAFIFSGNSDLLHY